MNGLNKFERSVKDSLDSFEVPYNSADWSQLERSLDEGNGSGRVIRSGLYALLFGGSVAAVSSLMLLLAPTPDSLGLGSGVETTGEQFTNKVQVAENDAKSPQASSQTISDGDVDSDDPTNNSQDDSDARKNSNTRTSDPGLKNRTESSAVAEAETKSSGNSTSPANTAPFVRASVNEGCPGTVVEFAVGNLPEEGIYLWNFGDGSFSNKPSPNHAFAKPGSFEVMLSHSSQGGGNIHNKPAADRIVIHEAPEATFNLLKQEYDNTVPSVHFENRSIRGKTYTWDFGDGSTSSIAHPDHVYKKAGLYHVSLTVTNAKGCVDRTERSVRIDSDYDLLSAKTFSPNGDGVEDVFIPEALKNLGVKFHFSVFDSKTGVLVFETTDPQRPWNGRVANRGDQCASGNYVWMVEMKDGEKLGGTYNGTIDLVR